MTSRDRMAGLAVVSILAAAIGLLAGVPPASAADDPQLARLEASASAEPENLWVGALYRQRAIQLGAFDRAIKTFTRLASRGDAGPNVFISLSLAYVDKVPAVGPFRRIFVGHDAGSAITKSIERHPSLVAYYIRGLISLFYPEGMFHRGRHGVADLLRARELAEAEPAQPYHVRVFISLGDGYWRIGDTVAARATWSEGLRRFPGDEALRTRLTVEGHEVDRVVGRALDSGTRVDTSLHELFPAAPAVTLEQSRGRLTQP